MSAHRPIEVRPVEALVPCRECGYDTSQLGPADAAVACRSFGRRWRELFDEILQRDEDGEALLARRASSGWTPIERCAHVAAVLHRAAQHLLAIRIHDQPSLDDVAPGSPEAVPHREDDLEARLVLIAEAGERAAAQIEAVGLADWDRIGTVDGEPISAFDVVRGAIHEAVHHLRLAGDELEHE